MGYKTWKEGAAERRDARATKAPEPERARSFRKKDTKRWCKGREGVEHQPDVKRFVDLKHEHREPSSFRRHSDRWLVRFCKVCGRDLDIWYGFRWTTRREKPAWVTEWTEAQKKGG